MDAAELVFEIYKSLTPTTVARCWLKAKVLPLPLESELNNSAGMSESSSGKKPTVDVKMLLDGIVKLSLDASTNFGSQGKLILSSLCLLILCVRILN